MRVDAAAIYSKEETQLDVDTQDFLVALEQAFYFSMIISYAQGMHLLANASSEYKYDLKLDEIAKIWRGGCIIWLLFLNVIYNAYKNNPSLAHLLLDRGVEKEVSEAV